MPPVKKYKGKFCRVCLKEIRSSVSKAHHLLQPPEPVIQLRNGLKASTYLHCYYYCIRQGGTTDHFNADSLMDYAYICVKCRVHLCRTIGFIVQSQKNEDFLMSMYENSTHDGSANDLDDELWADNKTADNTTIDLEYELFGTTKSDEEENDNDDYKQSNVGQEDENNLLSEYMNPNDYTMKVYQESLDNLLDIDSGSDINAVFNITSNSKESGATKVRSTEKDENNLKKSKNIVLDFEEILIEVENEETTSIKSSKKSANPSNGTKMIRKFNFKCESCCKVFKLERELHDHYNTHDVHELKFACDTCKTYFMSEDALLVHEDVVHNNKNYEDCEKCGKFIPSRDKQTHVEKEHDNKKAKHECKSCDRSFLTKSALVKHQETVHGSTKLNRHECLECDRFFFTTRNLKKHTQTAHNAQNRTHLDEEFLCDICSKTLTSKWNLKLHMQRHTGDVLKCSYCDKEFVTAKDLRIHTRFHTREFPFKCDKCQRTFAIKTHFDHHRKQHEGVRYKCQVCDKDFGHIFSLRQHSFKHRGYPFSCKLCEKGFPSIFKLRVHLKTRHRKIFNGAYTDEKAAEYITRNKIKKMYPQVEIPARI